MQNNGAKTDWKIVRDILPQNIKDQFLDILKQNLSAETESEIDSCFSKACYEETDVPIIFVGSGTCGLAAGADETYARVKEYLEKKAIQAKIIKVGCLGYCTEEPLLDIQLPDKNRICFSNVNKEKAEHILNACFEGSITDEDHIFGQYITKKKDQWKDIPSIYEHPFFLNQTKNVLKNCGIINPEKIENYLALGGYRAYLNAIHNFTPAEICRQVEKSSLRGRGGGGFPTGKKWLLTQEQKAAKKYMICNADEGDPGAFMDRAIIESDPHRLLEGLAIASYATGAEKAYVYIRAEYPLAISRLQKAIADAEKYRLLGMNILDSGFNLQIIIKQGAGAFVCGEETALIHSVEGKRGMPRPRPPYPSVKGLFGYPTTINNVETLANVIDIINNGPEWFNSIGTKSSKGTKVFALSGKVKRSGLVEVAMGTTIEDIVYKIGGGIVNDNKIKAVQIGGPSGGCLPRDQINIQIDYDSLKSVGAMMGSGGLVVMDQDNCMVDVAKFFMEFIQKESCGKCIPCREGTKHILKILQSITQRRDPGRKNEALERFQGILQLDKLARVIKQTSLCGLGQSAANPVLSTLEWFKDEYEEHIFERKCHSHVCQELLTYTINTELCKGCTVCIKNCPADAILGQVKSPHYIVSERCIGCGNCYQVCKFNAIAIA